MKTYVLECHNCGTKTADINNKIYKMGRCPKCGGASYRYRNASTMELILIKLHLMDIYK